jgi:hypothetical protein
MNEYYTLRVHPGEPDRIPASLSFYLDWNKLHISPNVNLCSHTAMAMLDDPCLAEKFRVYCEDKIKQRYGADSTVEIKRVTATGTPTGLRKLQARISEHTAKVRARLCISPDTLCA